MVFELVGSRVLAPHFGTSIFVWTNIIGVILGSLSLGYWLGGKIADREHNYSTLSIILILAGAFILLDTVGKDAVFEVVKRTTSHSGIGSLISSVVLFTVPSIFLGMISPYAARLKMQSVTTSGETVGNLYALSTLGSITGTFLAGFLLIPLIGSTKIFLFLSATLVIISTIVYSSKLLAIKVLLLLSIVGSYIVADIAQAQEMKQDILTLESAYNYVRIYDTKEIVPSGEAVKLMVTNIQASSGMFLGSDELVFDYTKFYRLGSHFKSNISSALMLGGAGYSYPKDFLASVPGARLDVVEIDPKLTELAHDYFRLPRDNPRLKIYHEDGRIFLNNASSSQYDVIYGDAFSSLHSIPYQLTTKEAVEKMFDALKSDGVVLVNIISAIEGEKGQFLRAEYATFKSVFPQVYIFPVTSPSKGEEVQNIMLVALKSSNEPSFISSNPELQSYLDHRWTKEINLDKPLLTDDFAPVDSYINKITAH